MPSHSLSKYISFLNSRSMMPGAMPLRGPPGQGSGGGSGGGGPRTGTSGMRGPMGRGDYGKLPEKYLLLTRLIMIIIMTSVY